MTKYRVLVNVIESRVVEVNAASETEALAQVKDMWDSEGLVLTSDDFYDVDFTVLYGEEDL